MMNSSIILGDCLDGLKELPDCSVDSVVTDPPNENNTKRNENGQWVKGYRNGVKTEFKPGQHWRPKQPWWDKDWLYTEYITKGRTSTEIAKDYNVTNLAIIYWLRKHDIMRRNASETRKIKHWGLSGNKNVMYGKIGELNPHWMGGITPDRQKYYNNIKWKKVSQYVWKRDNFTCQLCGKRHMKRADKFNLHHIESFKNKVLRFDENNLVLLCIECHHFVHSRENVNKIFIKDTEC